MLRQLIDRYPITPTAPTTTASTDTTATMGTILFQFFNKQSGETKDEGAEDANNNILAIMKWS